MTLIVVAICDALLCYNRHYLQYSVKKRQLTVPRSPALYKMVQSSIKFPRIELQCFLELDSQNWMCTEFRGNFYKVTFFFPSYFSALGQKSSEIADAHVAAPGWILFTIFNVFCD